MISQLLKVFTSKITVIIIYIHNIFILPLKKISRKKSNKKNKSITENVFLP